MKLTTRQLEGFLMTAELRSFTKAARILHVSQAGLSAMMQELESQIGQRLFHRLPRSVELTEAGLQFLPYARDALGTLEKAVVELGAQHRRVDGGIRVAVSPAVAETLVPAVVAEFIRGGKASSCEIVDTELDHFPMLLETDLVDAAYSNNPFVPRNLQADRIFSTALCLVVHRDAFPGCKVVSSPEDWQLLDGAIHLALPGRNVFQRSVDRYVQEIDMPGFLRQELQHLATILAFVHAGLGIAFVPEFMLGAYSRFDIRQIPVLMGEASVDFYCITRSDKRPSDSVRRFSALLAASGGRLGADD
jgi:DNA-binding transcriptional LysR family regulator